MKRHLNTLFITTQGAYLKKEGQAVAVRIERETRLRVPLHNLDAIACFGRVGASPALMGACAEAGVSFSFLTEHGRFIASVNGFTPGNVLLRRAQYRAADDPAISAELTRSIVLGKIANSRTVLLRAAREGADAESAERLKHAAGRLSASIVEVKAADSVDRLRGLEGEAASRYFSVFNDLVLVAGDTFRFKKRSRRPPLDPLNCLLSFLYTLLLLDIRSACEATGLDAAVGYLHRDRPGRPGLALDLMEEFRAPLADRVALTLINRQQLGARDFVRQESGAYLLTDDARKRVLVAWQERKQEETRHPLLDARTSVGLLVHLQARLMARRLRGDLDAYPPLIWK
ncbi:CRISPR-associated protein Cas4/endonuclease Cas1 fusion [Pirellulimonas nuda]|uniref:CRISPR-associated endonuclease Cas1 n=1 Tax=Pirellulimonas nuda TaxID=2528009 RepID=A0A518DAD5_9BACT|nr:type I-C CRISPR-associated endonuclease Cas1c [Pirellulimonas nuda]QDU88413.1 CRISPR-associated protein Cas4/endonuclease Cas1 fusion [Pirellulimonas nuda]